MALAIMVGEAVLPAASLPGCREILPHAPYQEWPASTQPLVCALFWPSLPGRCTFWDGGTLGPAVLVVESVRKQRPSCPQRLAVLVLLLMQGAVLLARAMKDYERRGGLKEGFSSAPADCVAYKFYRDVRPELPFSVMISACMVALHGVFSPCPEL